MATKKKAFGSAADAFLGVQLPTTTEKTVDVSREKIATLDTVEPKTTKTKTKELKTKSVLLKLTPTLYDKVKAAAEEEGLGFNTYVTTLLVKAVKQ